MNNNENILDNINQEDIESLKKSIEFLKSQQDSFDFITTSDNEEEKEIYESDVSPESNTSRIIREDSNSQNFDIF